MSVSLFNSNVFESFLKTKWLGRSVIHKDVTETTMDDAKVLSRTGSPFGTVVVAEIQTNARGTKSHKWNALNKGNLYVSLIINRKVQQEEFVDRFDVEVAAALSVLTVLQELGLQGVKLKWPNDIWVRGHKLAGFLAEDSGQLHGSAENIYILGIGLNVNADVRRNPDLHAIASSIKCELDGKIINREKLFADICNNLETALEWNRDILYTKAMENQLFNSRDKVKINHLVGGKISIGPIEKISDDWNIIFKDESDKIWQGTSQKYSIRPYTTETIYVYNGVMTAPWSATLLIKTFSALIDTSILSVSSLNDARLKEGSWKKNAAMLVVGDILLDKFQDNGKGFLAEIQSYVENGGNTFSSGSATNILLSHIFISSESEVNLEGLDIREKGTKEMSSVKIKLKDSEKQCIGVTVNKNMAVPPAVLQTCNIFGHYSSFEGQISDAGAVVVKHGKGLIGMFGFNVEITYADIGDITSSLLLNKVNDIGQLEETVFERDLLVKNVINYLLMHENNVQK